MAEARFLGAGGKRMQRHTPAMDGSLPSLTWLKDFSVKDTGMAKPPSCFTDPDAQDKGTSFTAPCSPLAADPACTGIPRTPCTPVSSST